MNLILTIILIVSNLITLTSADCQDENGLTKNQTITWSALNDAIVISEPACLNKEGKFITRQCQNGNWFPPELPDCDDYQFITKCPQGFLQISKNCLQIRKPAIFKERCPFPGVKYYDYTKIILSGKFWMPIIKVNSTFRYISPDKRYGKEFKVNQSNLTGDCFVYNQNIIQTTSCNTLNRHICSYKIAELTDKKFAENSTTRLELKFDMRREKIFLNVYSPENLLTNDDDEYAIFCFTDASLKELKTSVKKKIIFNSFKKKRSKFLENLVVYVMSIKHDFPGQYWCEAYNRNNEISESNVIIASKKRSGHEFVLSIVLLNACVNNDCFLISPELIYDYLEKLHFKEVFKGIDFVYRVMHIFDSNHGDVEAILHLSTLNSTKLTAEYSKLLLLLKLLPLQIDLKYIRSGEACVPDSKNNLTWKLTAINNNATPREFCLDSNGIPIQRKCMGDFLNGAYWSDDSISCSDYKINKRTKKLYNLSITEVTENITEEIKNITSTPNLSPIDIYLVANTLNNLTYQNSEHVVVDNFVETIDNIQENDREILKESQLYLNATDTILDSIDKFLRDDILLSNVTQIFRKDKFIVHITRPFLSNTNGVAIYNFVDDKFATNEIIDFKINQTFDDLNQTNLEIAYYIPVELLESIIFEEDYDRDNLTVITTIYYNDNLFNPIGANVEQTNINGHVISVTIPDYGLFLEEPIQILFRNPDHRNNESKCSFWEYGVNSNDGRGRWSSLGGNFLGNTNEFSQCAFTHLTHFALLIMSQTLTVNEFEAIQDLETFYENSNYHNDILNVISISGCILSLLGILGMFVTAACFERWRNKVGTKILLQLAITIMVESTVVHLANSDYFPDNSIACGFIGMCLHYIVLSKFSWMCVSAVLQYIRFVKILTVLPTRLVLKTSFFGWVLPLFPVFILACSDPDSYKAGQQKFCYPNGIGLYVSLFLPVVLIVTINLVMFILIMFNVLRSNIEGHKRKNSQRLQIYLGILLFFMLGLPWVFGILAEILRPSYLQLVFIYLFCLTATLEGLVLFVFYVILDGDTRKLWTTKFSRYW